MRILWVKIGGLWPANSGGRLRSFHLLAELSHQHELTVVTTRLPDESHEQLVQQLPRCQRVLSLPYTPAKYGTAAFLACLLRSWFSPLPVDLCKNRVAGVSSIVSALLAQESFDICVADFLAALPNLPARMAVPVVQFSHNVEYMIWQRLCNNQSSWMRRMLLTLEWRKLRHYEQRACRHADLTITVSEADRSQLLALAPDANIMAVPTGVDIDYFRPSGTQPEQALDLVFSGSMDWFPNEDGMLWFMETALPLIRRALPAVRLTIVGRNPGPQLQRMAAANAASVTGTVADVRPAIEAAAVYVVPLRIGGGTRLKIFEALAMGKAIVSTTIGAEGLPLEDGKHLLLADSPQVFADKVLLLLQNPALRTQLGEAGRHLVASRYSWHSVAQIFGMLCNTAVATINPHNPQLILQKGSEP